MIFECLLSLPPLRSEVLQRSVLSFCIELQTLLEDSWQSIVFGDECLHLAQTQEWEHGRCALTRFISPAALGNKL